VGSLIHISKFIQIKKRNISKESLFNCQIVASASRIKSSESSKDICSFDYLSKVIHDLSTATGISLTTIHKMLKFKVICFILNWNLKLFVKWIHFFEKCFLKKPLIFFLADKFDFFCILQLFFRTMSFVNWARKFLFSQNTNIFDDKVVGLIKRFKLLNMWSLRVCIIEKSNFLQNLFFDFKRNLT
jgi:hypothetical protein